MSQADSNIGVVVPKASDLHVTRACDMCRKKKIRCEPTSDICVQCSKYKTSCHFTPIKVKRRPRRANGQPRVDELERRLKRMEEELKLAAQRRTGSSTEGESSPESMEIVRHESPPQALAWPTQAGWGEDFSQHTSDFQRPSCGPRPQSLVTLSFTDGFSSMQDTYLRGDWNLTAQHSLFARRIFKPLPEKQEAIRLIKTAFEGFNSVFPIFDHNSFIRMNLFSQDFSDPSWWACVNVTLALGHRFQALRTIDNISEDRKAWGYFQNALSVSTELSMLHPSVTAIQAFLGMAIIVQGTPNTSPHSSLLSTAIKMAHSMGLHRNNQSRELGTTEIELRKQVFWVAYFLDKDLSLRSGEPPNQDDDEMDVELPIRQLSRPPWSGSQDSGCFLQARIQLAKIQGQVYKRLLSIKASRQPAQARRSAVRDLHAALMNWRTTVPIDFESEYFTPTLDAPEVTPIMHEVTTRLSYFKTMTVIHRFSDSAVARSEAEVGVVHELPPPITCVEEARKALKLLHITPREDYGCIWVVLHIFVSATITLLNHIITSPFSSHITSDLALIEPLLKLLGKLAKRDKSEEITKMFVSCNDLWHQATSLVAQSRNDRIFADRANEDDSGMYMDVLESVENTGSLDASTGEKESVEDFIRRIEMISQGVDEDGTDGFANFSMFSR